MKKTAKNKRPKLSFSVYVEYYSPEGVNHELDRRFEGGPEGVRRQWLCLL